MLEITPDLGIKAEIQEQPFADTKNQAVWKEIHKAMGFRLHFHEGKKIEVQLVDGTPHAFYPTSMRLWEFTNLPGSRVPMAKFGENMRAIGVSIARSVSELLQGKETAEILAKEFYSCGVGLLTGKKAEKRRLKHIAGRSLSHPQLSSIHHWLSGRGLYAPNNDATGTSEEDATEIQNSITQHLVGIFHNIDTCLQILNHPKKNEREENKTACQNYIDAMRKIFNEILQYPKKELLDGMLNASKSLLLEDLHFAVVDERMPGFRKKLQREIESLNSVCAGSALFSLAKLLEDKGAENAITMIGSYFLETRKGESDTGNGTNALVPLPSASENNPEMEVDTRPVIFGDNLILKPEAARELVRILTSAEEEGEHAVKDPRDPRRLEQGHLYELLQIEDFRRQLHMVRQMGDLSVAADIESAFSHIVQLTVASYEYQSGSFSVNHARGHKMNCVGKSITGGTLLDAVGIHHLTVSLHNVPHAVDLLITSEGKVQWCDMGCPQDNEELTDDDLIGVTIQDILNFQQEGDGSLYFELKPRKKRIYGTKEHEVYKGSIFHPNAGHSLMILGWIASNFQCNQRHEEAIGICKLGLGICNDGLYGSLCRSLAALDRKEELLAVAAEALQKVPNDVGCLYDIGQSLIGIGEYKSAAEIFGHILKKAPDHRYVHYNIGCCHAAMGQHRAALISYGNAMKNGMELIEVAHLLVYSLRKLGDTMAADAILNQIHQTAHDEIADMQKDEWWEYFDEWQFEEESES